MEEDKTLKSTKSRKSSEEESKVWKDEEINDKGNKAIKCKKNNKYYWEKPLEFSGSSLPKICQKGGLNCASCMRLDIQANGITMLGKFIKKSIIT